MTTWKKAIVIATVLEAPAFVASWVTGPGFDRSFLGLLLVWYHVIPLTILTLLTLLLFGHGGGGHPAWQTSYWVFTYVIQVAVTAPIVFLLLRFWDRQRHQRQR